MDGPVVLTAGGRVRGRSKDGVHSFLGIPYAAPPVGDLRFAAPAPVARWDGERDATAYGPTVAKPPYDPPYDLLLPEPVVDGEDSLNLNVWTPDPGATGLPVMVWVHGGAFVHGSGAVPTYDGSAFARDGVVAVTLNYRLGADGFLLLDGVPANLGLRDQLAALRWVQDNIAAFGGDPAAVTVAGESAGAMSVGALLSSPYAEGLFRGAVLQSGAGHHALTRETAGRVTSHLAGRLGVPATREGFSAVALPALHQAQQELSQQVQLAPDPARWGELARNLMVFEPVIDGDVLPELPITSMSRGAGRDVAVLAGCTADEQNLFLVPNGVSTLVNEALLSAAAAGYGLPVEQALQTYRGAKPGASHGELLSDLSSDWFFRMPVVRLAEARAALGNPIHVYEFTWSSPQYNGRLGACHALELGFVFDHLDAEGGQALQGLDPPQALASEMHAAWVRFVSTGEPGWPAYDVDSRAVMHFGTPSRVTGDARSAQRRLWEGLR